MPGKIFISCGQATDQEKRVASEVKEKLKGFRTYIAINTQSLQDVNTEIIGNLKSSDFYIFIDIAREKIGTALDGSPIFRGSLFTHQELSIAYAFGFEKVLYLKQEGVLLEGIGKYLLSNALPFKDLDQVPSIVENEIFVVRKWSPKYSRHLVVGNLTYAGLWTYGDHAAVLNHHIYHIEIQNLRNELAAFNTVARLNEIILPNGKKVLSPDRSFLKWAGKIAAYSSTLLPNDCGLFDALSLDQFNLCSVFLHSEEDRPPRKPIINSLGNYVLRYQVFSQGFPILEFDISLVLTENLDTTRVQLV